MKSCLALLCWLTIFSWQASAQRETFDLFSFIAPQGWERKVQKDVITFLKTDENQTSYCLIGVFDSRVGTNDLRKEFLIEWNSLIESGKHIAAPAEPKIESGTNGWSVVSGSAMSATAPPYLANLITMVGQGRVVSVLFYISDEKFMPEVKQFISTMQLVQPQTPSTQSTTSVNPNPIDPMTQGGGNLAVAGLWRSMCNDKSEISGVTNSAGTGFSSFSTSSGGLRVRHIIFFPDGTFCHYVSERGYINYQDQRKQDPNIWGTYRYGNGFSEVKLDGSSSSDQFVIQDGKMKYDRCTFEHLPWVEDLRLNATYTVEGDPTAYKANKMNAEPIIKFTSDGRFSDEGAVYYLNHVKNSSTDNSDNKYGDGRYEIKLYTLSLYFDDGRTYHYTYLNLDGNVYNPPQIGVALKWLNRK